MSATVVTVTLHPAIDQTITVKGLCPGKVQRARAVEYNAGGKGINVASCLADWGIEVTATGILGTANAEPFETLLASKGIRERFVRVAGDNRVNIKIADIDRDETTDINLPGLRVGPAVLDKVHEVLSSLVGPGSLVVLAGSLPEGLSDDTNVELIAEVNCRGGRVFLDTSGNSLTAALAAQSDRLPFCVKPNRAELEAWVGAALPRRSDLLMAAQRLRDRGIGLVVVSLGVEGALFVSSDGAFLGHLPEVKPLSSVGAGDAMVAGLVAGFQAGATLEEVSRLSVAFATAKLERLGPHLPDVETVRSLAAQVELTVLGD